MSMWNVNKNNQEEPQLKMMDVGDNKTTAKHTF